MKPEEAIEWLIAMKDRNDYERKEALNIAITALKKQQSQSPKDLGLSFFSYHTVGKCAVCGEGVDETWNYCPHCGQAIKWG